MKKLTLPIFLSLLFLLVFFSTVSAAPDLNGTWSGFGYSFKASQTGNSITLTATDGDIRGKVSLTGTITGNALEGQQILVAKGCPNLEKYVSAKGTISSDGNSITVTYKNFDYDPSRCVDLPGSQSEETGSYSKVSSPPIKTIPPKPKVKEDQTEPEPGSKITCSEVWKIVGSEDCERFVVSNDEGGLWCNLPDTRESLQPWIYGPAPTYTFTPGTCSVESADQPGENPKTPESEVKDGIQKELPKAGLPLFARGWLDYFRNLWVIVSYRGQDPLIGFVNAIGGMDHTLCDPSSCEKSMEAARRGTDLTEEDVIFRSQSDRANATNPYQLHEQTGNASISDYDKSKGFNMVTGKDDVIFSTFIGLEGDKGGLKVSPNTKIELPPEPFQKVDKDSKTSSDVPSQADLDFGEVEIIIIGSAEKPTIRPTFTVATPNAQVTVSGTHFWVSYDKDKNTSTVGVYEGKVEVKTKDGKKTTVSPDGDPSTGSGQSKPGVITVSSRVSAVKLAVIGLVLAAVVGGIVILLKRKKKRK